MRFSRLLSEAAIQARRRGDAEVLSVCDDSRRCGAGSCFVAVRGACDDGHKYIRAAAAAGCKAVVCQDASAVPAGLPCAVVEDTRRVAGPLAQAVRSWPARELINIAVTGTNGKSTATHLIDAILQAGGFQPAMLGTISYKTGSRSVPARTTTPGAVALAEMMDEMLAAGRTHLVMEVSSHALDQHRVCGIDFQVGVFTNLSGDHLDYHGTMDAYLAAKRRLFETLANYNWYVIGAAAAIAVIVVLIGTFVAGAGRPGAPKVKKPKKAKGKTEAEAQEPENK